MNSWSAPQWVLLAHPPDEIAQLPLNSWPAWPTSRFPAPVGPKSRSLPPQDGGWLNNLGQTEQARPHSGHPNHQGSVTCPELETFRGSPQSNVKLMTQKEFSTSSRCRHLKRSATKAASRWMIANIA